MQCVLFAAGKGTRMRPLTDTVPKPLVSVAGRPLVEYILDVLPPSIDEVILVVKYLGAHIQAHLGDRYRDLPITYVTQGVLDGTGGALLAAQPLVRDRFLVMNADDLHGPAALALAVKEELAVLAATVAEPQHFGVLTVSSEGLLVGIEEKPHNPTSNVINTGAMVLDQRIFQHVTEEVGGEVRLTDMVIALAQEAPVRVVQQDRWCAVGCPEHIPSGERFVRAVELGSA